MDPHDKRLSGLSPRVKFVPAPPGLILPISQKDLVRGSLGLRRPGMKEGCSGENVLERER